MYTYRETIPKCHIYMQIHVHTCTYVNVQVNRCVYTREFLCILVCVYIHACIHTYIHAYISHEKPAKLFGLVETLKSQAFHTYVHTTYTHTYNIHTHIPTYTHTYISHEKPAKLFGLVETLKSQGRPGTYMHIHMCGSMYLYAHADYVHAHAGHVFAHAGYVPCMHMHTCTHASMYTNNAYTALRKFTTLRKLWWHWAQEQKQ